jgi:flagellar motor switch protein FliG
MAEEENSSNEKDGSDKAIHTMATIDKVAHFLVMMGEDATVKIFQHLPSSVIEKISQKIVAIKSIDKDVGIDILDEFYVITQSQNYLSSGGYEYAKEILHKALNSSEATKILDRLARVSKKGQAFQYIDKVNPKQLAEFIKDESPQTVAIILAHMDASSSAETLNTFSDEKKVLISMHMASIKDISPDVVNTISKVLENKLDLFATSSLNIGGTKTVADMLNRVGTNVSKEILDDMMTKDKELTDEIKSNMFVFEDLTTLEDDAIQKILQNLDVSVIALALKSASDEVKDTIINNMSQRVQASFQEEFEMLTKVKVKDVEEAQRQVLDATQKLLDSGEIERGGADDTI